MTTEKSPNKKESKHVERVSLSDEAKDITDSWLDQIKPLLHGAKISRSEIVSWCIKEKAGQLTKKELADLENLFFDPLKLLEAAAAKVKAMLAHGEKVDLETVLQLKQRRVKDRLEERLTPTKRRSKTNKEQGPFADAAGSSTEDQLS